LRFVEHYDEVTSLFEVGRHIRAHSFPAFVVAERQSRPLHECPAMAFGVFALSARSWSVLKPVIDRDVQAIRLTGLETEYFAINILSVLPALNLRKSKITTFSNGKVDRVLKFVFDEDVIAGHHIFRIPERNCDVFVSEEFLTIAVEAKLKGFKKSDPVFRTLRK
jgi:hypothetical protein